jgi:hypothetical protein
MRSIHESDRLCERFYYLLDRPGFRDVLYVYRLDSAGISIKPAMLKRSPFSGLQDYLRDEHGGGAFLVMIRRGDTMLLAGRIDIAPPPQSNHRSERH